MKYAILFKPRAMKDIRRIPSQAQAGLLRRIEDMGDNLKGDVKKLADHTTEYSLRAGD